MLVQAEVLPALSKEEVALPPIGRALADALVPSAVHSAGEHLAAGVNGLRRGSFSYDLRSAQDQAVYAAANGKVPDRPPPAVTPRQAAPPLTITVRPGGTEQPGKTPADIPSIVAVLSTMAVRLSAAAFAEAAALLLAGLPAAVVAGVLLYLVIKLREKEGQETLIPPAVPPQEPGSVLPASPVEKPGEGGFSSVPSPDKPGEGGTMPAPALPHVEEGPGVVPPMPAVLPMARPTITKEDEERRQAIIRSYGLPTSGEHPYEPPDDWNTRGKPNVRLPRGKSGALLDKNDQEWVRPRGDKMTGGKPSH